MILNRNQLLDFKDSLKNDSSQKNVDKITEDLSKYDLSGQLGAINEFKIVDEQYYFTNEDNLFEIIDNVFLDAYLDDLLDIIIE